MEMWTKPFKPNLLNSVVFLVETSQIISVLFVNYKVCACLFVRCSSKTTARACVRPRVCVRACTRGACTGGEGRGQQCVEF
jgi:hypothetical protein